MSMFDPDLLIGAETDAVMDTTFPTVREGEYTAQIANIKPRGVKKRDSSEEFVMLDILWELSPEEIKDQVDMERFTVRQSIFLDLTEDGLPDTGKGRNIQLGRVREAVGQNVPGPWALGMLVGAVAKVHVTERPDDKDTSRIYNDVKSVTSIH